MIHHLKSYVMLCTIGRKNSNDLIRKIHYLFLVGFLFVHQGIIITDGFLLKKQSWMYYNDKKHSIQIILMAMT